jgi:manganese/zinc/iron transport system permease protein
LVTSITFKVMMGTTLLGVTAGVVGSYAVLRRRALVSDMLAHAALPGICLAFLIVGARDIFALSIGALATGLVGLLLVTVLCRWTRTKEDAAIGIVLSTFFGAGVVLLSFAQRHHQGNQAGLDTYLFGEIAAMQSREVRLLLAVGTLVLLAVFALHKEFKVLAFDSDFAASQGWPIFILDFGMMALLAVVTVVGLPICGVILMAALIILPSAAARFWTNRLEPLLLLAGLFGGASAAGGTLLASPVPQQLLGFNPLAFGWHPSHLPPGPLIVLTTASLLVVSLVVAPQHGIAARLIGEFRLRARIFREHLLRSLYEMSEAELPALPAIAESTLVDYRSWNRLLVDWQVRRAERHGLVELQDGTIRLTADGLTTAADLTRTHRLWELFLVEYANIAADHVDRDADDVEHLLPQPLIDDLQRRLAEEGRLPLEPRVDVPPPNMPESPHELEP